MGVKDGRVLGISKILDAGATSERFNLVLVAEGYQENELNKFEASARQFVQKLFATPPFDRHSCSINVWRLDVASLESGADDPKDCGGTGAAPRTYFDATFCTGGIRRLLNCNRSLVIQTVETYLPEFHSAQVIVNSSIYGGSGGSVGVSSTATQNDAGEPRDWWEIVIHEMGHSIFALADEYGYFAGCDGEDGTSRNQYVGDEPLAANITKSRVGANKWSDLINTSSLPTWENQACELCPPELGEPGGPTESQRSIVGTFEGAHTYHCGIYRPQATCKMQRLGEPFCAVCQRVISEYLAPFDPDFCLERDKIDASRWSAVATILFGVIQDGGGVIIVDGKPVPIDPWGPLRNSLWGAMANPQEADSAVRDVLVGTALQQISSLATSPKDRRRLERAINRYLDKAARKLPKDTIR